MKNIPETNDDLQVAADAFKDFLIAIGADLTDPNLKDTPLRVAKMFKCELLAGMNPANEPTITSFPSEGDFDPEHELVITKGIPVRSTCAHHIMPIIGYADIGAFYMKDKGSRKRISFPGLSKYARVLNYYARRFQLQERIGHQVAEHLLKKTEAKMVLVRINAVHHCMCSRGITAENSNTTTLAIRHVNDKAFLNIEGLNSIESITSRFLREVSS